jgi:hypothetical protein
MNEPWPGDVFSNPLLFLPGVADKRNLAPFYEKLQAAVRSVDRERILFFETITFDNFRCGLKTVPGGKEWQNKTVLSYHYYTPPNFSTRQTFAERIRESRRLGCGSMLTEFFVSTELRQNGTDFRKFRQELLDSSFEEALQLNEEAEGTPVPRDDGLIEADEQSHRRLEEVPIGEGTSATDVDTRQSRGQRKCRYCQQGTSGSR